MKEKIKTFFKRHFTKIALAVSAFALAISCLSTPTYAYTSNEDGVLISSNMIDCSLDLRAPTHVDYRKNYYNGYQLTTTDANGGYAFINQNFEFSSTNQKYNLNFYFSTNTGNIGYVYLYRYLDDTFTNGFVEQVGRYTENGQKSINFTSISNDVEYKYFRVRLDSYYSGMSANYTELMLSPITDLGQVPIFEPYGQVLYDSTKVNQIINDQVAQQNIIKSISSNVYLTRTNGITTDLGANRSGLFSDFAYDDDIVKVQYVFDRQVDLNTLLIDLFWTHDIGGNYIQSVVTDKGYIFDISNLTEENHYIYSDDVAKCNSITIYFTKSGNLYNFNSSLWLRFTQNNAQYYQSFFQSGYNSGYNEASSMITRDYENQLSKLYEQFKIEKDQAYTKGHKVGLSEGRAETSSGAYEAGYAAGRAEVPTNSTTNFKDVIWTIATTPFESFKTIWNVDLLGVNIAAFFTAIITLGLGIFILKKIL